MRGSQRSAAISEAVATRQPLSTTRQNTHSQPIAPENQQAAHTVYFNISVYDMSDPDEPELVEQLRAGKTYLLAITCDDAPSPINGKVLQFKQAFAGPFSLAISYTYDVSVASPTTPAKQWSPFQDIFQDQFPGELILPADLPACNVTIKVLLRTQQRTFPTTVVQYTLPVCGEGAAPPVEIFETSQIHQRLPEKTAILLVETATRQAMQKQQIRLRGWSEAGQQLNVAVPMNVIISVEGLQEYRNGQQKQPLDPDAILYRLTYFSRHSPPPFLHWLHTLLRAYQEPFNLIIVDLTEKEIPWELIEIKRGAYLGACARVVRWLPTQYFAGTRNLLVQPDRHAGPIISYLDTQIEAKLIHEEQAALHQLAGHALSSLADLKRRLEDSLEEVGMIYIGCHGRAGQHLLQHDVPELSSIMLESLYECASPRLTVFMNACESARTVKKSPDDQSNFVDAFLGYCASGFIGTLAQVDIATASMIARHILLSALQPDGIQIAEQLRQLRKAELERFWKLKRNKAATPADYYRVVDTFMYIYYGNPLARLQLHQKERTGQ